MSINESDYILKIIFIHYRIRRTVSCWGGKHAYTQTEILKRNLLNITFYPSIFKIFKVEIQIEQKVGLRFKRNLILSQYLLIKIKFIYKKLFLKVTFAFV